MSRLWGGRLGSIGTDSVCAHQGAGTLEQAPRAAASTRACEHILLHTLFAEDVLLQVRISCTVCSAPLPRWRIFVDEPQLAAGGFLADKASRESRVGMGALCIAEPPSRLPQRPVLPVLAV